MPDASLLNPKKGRRRKKGSKVTWTSRKVGLVRTMAPVISMRTGARTVALSAIDFVLSASVRRKRNQKEKERPNLTRVREESIEHMFVLSMNNN